MARTHPEGWRLLPAEGARGRELATLARLAAALPEDTTIYHGLHWTRAEGRTAVFGEVDIAACSPVGVVPL
ncbi:MAG TPA: nuclease, partial [Thauera aminoaromatica]|nr:nuclease [Thauera aminoaromatica]